MMKQIILLIVLTLVAGNAYAISGKALNEAQALKIKVEQEQQAERTKKIEAENAEKERQFNEKREIYLQSKGKGFILTVEEINALENDIYNRKPVRIFTDGINGCRGVSGMQAIVCSGGIEGGLKNYPGSSHSFNTASAHIVDGNTIIDFAFAKLLSYEAKRPDGTHETYTWNKNKGLTTYKVTDGTSMMIAKINMEYPKKTRIVDANLPVNAMNTITQLYNKRGVNLSEKILLTMLEDFYKEEVMKSGKTVQSTMTDLLTEVDFRDDFLKFCKRKAKTATKPVDDDE